MPIRVLTAHDMLLFDRPSDYPYRKRLLLAESYRRSLDTSDLIIADSNATADRVKAYNARHGNKIVTIPLAVASSLLNATPSPVRALKSRPFALVVGDASPRKNLSTLVDSWPHVVAQVPDAVLTIVGPPGWGTNYFGRRFNEMVAEGHVLTLGHVSDAELRWLYQTCVVTLCPSRLEGFGLPAAEASAFGAPIIRSNDSALREASNNRGIELSPDDADGWTQEIVNAFNHGRREIPHQTPRLWPEVCEETIDAVSSVLGPRYKGDANSPAT